VLWLVIAVVVLKFNHASVVTVGVLTGLMFLLFAAEEFALAALDRSARWLWIIFGVLMTAAGIVALIYPEATFAGFADILGFVFLLIGVLWMVQAFMERVLNLPVDDPDQRHPDGRDSVLGQRPVLPHARGHAAGVRRHLGGDEGHHRHRPGPSNSPPGFLAVTAA
jgi:Short repeat of unknown function (DUF308)